MDESHYLSDNFLDEGYDESDLSSEKSDSSSEKNENENCNEEFIDWFNFSIDSKNAILSNRLIFKTKYPEVKDCPVCMINMKGKTVGHTPCGHTFCRDCLVNQIDKSNYPDYKYKCSLCRNDLETFMSSIETYNRIEKLKTLIKCAT